MIIKKYFKNNLFFKRFLVIFSSAYILMFFSEYFFINEEPAFGLISALTTNPFELLFLSEFILWYVFFAYILFIAIDKFQVRNLWALFLAGALYGWWTEGVIIPVMYQALPFSISWTSLGWHAIIDVILGLYLIRKILYKNNYWYTILLSSSLGLFWGLWATWFWSEGVDAILPLNFVFYSFFTGILLILAYVILDNVSLPKLRISKTEIGIFIILSLGAITLQSTYLGVLPWLVLLPLFAITFFALVKNKKIEQNPDIHQVFQEMEKIKGLNYLILILIPLIASITYAFMYAKSIQLPIDEIVWLLVSAGLILFVLSFVKVVFRKSTKKSNL